MQNCFKIGVALIVAASCVTTVLAELPTLSDPFAALAIYDGEWAVHAQHPWSGAAVGAVDRLTSRCHSFSAYFVCEQTINSKPTSLLVYTLAEGKRLHTRTITPDGLAGGRGDLSLLDKHWTYLDKPPASLKGNWSRVENFIVDQDHIRFEEYESADEGRTWKLINTGQEERQRN